MQTAWKMNNANPDIPEARRHALQYWNIDGVPIIFHAVSYLLLCGLFTILIWLLATVGDPELGIVFFFLGLPASVFAFAWFAYRSEDFIEIIKQRVTYPRTGYAAPPSQWKKSERDEAFDASFGRLSSVARFLRKRWILFYCALFLLKAVNDVFDHPFHPSISSREAFIAALGVLSGMLRIPGFFRNKLVLIEVVGYPLLGFLAANNLRQQQLILFVTLVAFAPALLVLMRGILTLIRYVRQNPLPPS